MTHAVVAPAGIEVRAELPVIEEVGALKALVDKAWQAVKHGLVRGLSIGFRPLDVQPLPSGGLHIKSWVWLELSLVTCAANPQAAITAAKAAEDAAPAVAE